MFCMLLIFWIQIYLYCYLRAKLPTPCTSIYNIKTFWSLKYILRTLSDLYRKFHSIIFLTPWNSYLGFFIYIAVKIPLFFYLTLSICYYLSTHVFSTLISHTLWRFHAILNLRPSWNLQILRIKTPLSYPQQGRYNLLSIIQFSQVGAIVALLFSLNL